MSARFPDEIIDRIREANDIVDVISKDVQLKKAGNRYTGLCPFHVERTPSFSVSRDKQLFYCFGCQAAGNVFSYVMKYEGLSFFEAVIKLGGMVGMDLSEYSDSSAEDDEERNMRELLIKVNHFAAEYYNFYLLKSTSLHTEAARKYLAHRGMSEEMIKKFKVGYAPFEGKSLISSSLQKGIEKEYLISLGLASSSAGNVLSDRFKNRIMFPIFNVTSKVIGFGGRSIDDTHPKYLNSNENLLFSKKNNLFGLNLAVSSIRSKGYAVLMEGYMDVIAAHQAGVQNAVASLGTAFTFEQAKLLSRYCRQVTVCYDDDKAGIQATKKAIEILRSAKLEVKVVALTGGMDPDSLLKEKGIVEFNSVINNSCSDTRYLIESIISGESLGSIEERVKCLKELIPVLSNVIGQTERLEYIREIAGRLTFDFESVVSDVNRYRRGMRNSAFHTGETGDSSKNVAKLTEESQNSVLTDAEKEVFKSVIFSGGLVDKVIEVLDEETLSSEEHRNIMDIFKRKTKNKEKISLSALIDVVDEKHRDYVSSAFGSNLSENSEPNLTVEESLKALSIVRIKRRLKELDNMVHVLESKGDFEALKELFNEQKELRKILGQNVLIY